MSLTRLVVFLSVLVPFEGSSLEGKLNLEMPARLQGVHESLTVLVVGQLVFSSDSGSRRAGEGRCGVDGPDPTCPARELAPARRDVSGPRPGARSTRHREAPPSFTQGSPPGTSRGRSASGRGVHSPLPRPLPDSASAEWTALSIRAAPGSPRVRSRRGHSPRGASTRACPLPGPGPRSPRWEDEGPTRPARPLAGLARGPDPRVLPHSPAQAGIPT